MIDYHDYLPESEIEWNTNTWLDQGESPEQIEKWLTKRARIVKAEQSKGNGTDDIKAGASCMGAILLLMVLLFMLFMIIAVIGS